MKFVVQIDREADGRWIGEIAELPGVLAYRKTRKKAIAAVEALAFRVLADRLEHGEAPQGLWTVTFEPAA